MLALLLTSAGVIGLWGIGFFSPRLVQLALEGTFKAEGLSGDALKAEVGLWRGITSLVQNAGAFFGIFAFSWVTGVLAGDRPSPFSFVLALVSTAGTFWFLGNHTDILWMIPVMGFCQLARCSAATRFTFRSFPD